MYGTELNELQLREVEENARAMRAQTMREMFVGAARMSSRLAHAFGPRKRG